MQCKQCHAELVEEADFCHQCGKQTGGSGVDESPRERLQNAISDRKNDDVVENELWQGKFSKLAMIGAWIGAAVVTLVLLVVAAVQRFSGNGWLTCLAVIALVWIGLLARLLYRQLSEHYFLTNRRFIHERGLLWREINRIEAIDIDDVSFQQGPIERFLGVGTISIRSSDNTHPEMQLPGIENVRDVAEMIDEVRRQERRRRGLYVESV